VEIQEWKESGTDRQIAGHRLFYHDVGAGPDTIVILHGYPTSSHDFEEVLPVLSENYRVIIHDHPGFGFSEKPADYSYAITEQADHALKLWQSLGVNKAHLVAHDYGTSVATEIIARRNMGFEPVELQSLTLSNGSVHIELAKLRFIQKLLRSKTFGPLIASLTSKRIFRKNMRKLWHEPARLTESQIDAMWSLLILNGGKEVLPRITQYLRDRERFWFRWVGALQESDLRSLILWGASDPITGENVARVHHEEMKGSRLELLERVGHYPMLEAPERWSRGLLDFLERTDRH
jgi:pimeloyl-ACP methyl ester carboxylesterase